MIQVNATLLAVVAYGTVGLILAALTFAVVCFFHAKAALSGKLEADKSNLLVAADLKQVYAVNASLNKRIEELSKENGKLRDLIEEECEFDDDEGDDPADRAVRESNRLHREDEEGGEDEG